MYHTCCLYQRITVVSVWTGSDWEQPTTSGPQRNASYTLVKTAGVVHYRSAVFFVYFHQSLNGRRAYYLIFSAGYMHICKCNDSASLLTISCRRWQFICIQRWSVHVVHYKPTDRLNLIVSPNVWRPCKWFTFHCYVVIFCILTTVRQFSTTSGPHWNVIYTLLKTAGVVHYRSAVCSRILSSVTEWQACILSDIQCRLHANMQM